jgi:hypothetical protein
VGEGAKRRAHVLVTKSHVGFAAFSPPYGLFLIKVSEILRLMWRPVEIQTGVILSDGIGFLR